MTIVLGEKLYINDVDLATFNCHFGFPKGFLSAPGASHKLVPVPNRVGNLRVAREQDIGPRRFTVDGIIRGSTEAEVKGFWHQAVQVLADESVEVRFPTSLPEMMALATYEGIDWIELPGARLHFAQIRLTFLMPNPHKVATQEDVYTIASGQEVPIALGNAPSDVRLRLIGTGAANPTVLYRDAQGRVAGDVSYNTAFPLGSWIELDGAFQTSELHSTAGTVANGSPFVDQSSGFIVLDPADGDDVQGPTLSPLNCDLVVYVRKAWR